MSSVYILSLNNPINVEEYQLELPEKNMSEQMPSAFPKPTSGGSHPIEELEYFAMLVNTIWVRAATDVRMKNIVENVMDRYEAAQASGLVISLSPSREEELRRKVQPLVSDLNTVKKEISSWAHSFRAGASARMYSVPSFTADSEESQQQNQPPATEANVASLDGMLKPLITCIIVLAGGSLSLNSFKFPGSEQVTKASNASTVNPKPNGVGILLFYNKHR